MTSDILKDKYLECQGDYFEDNASFIVSILVNIASVLIHFFNILCIVLTITEYIPNNCMLNAEETISKIINDLFIVCFYFSKYSLSLDTFF